MWIAQTNVDPNFVLDSLATNAVLCYGDLLPGLVTNVNTFHLVMNKIYIYKLNTENITSKI